MSILVLGDANADLSARLRRFPAEGGDSPLDALGWGSGGAGVNVAAALALLGSPARLLARVGRDPAANVALRAANAGGVDLSLVQVDPDLATGLCFAAVSPGGERTFFSFRGANAALSSPPGDALTGARWLHLCGHALLEGQQRETALALLAAANQRALPVSLDLCLPLIHERRAELLDLLPRLDTLFANETELAALSPDLFATEGTEIKEGSGSKRHVAVPRPPPPSVLSVAKSVRLVVKLGARGCQVAAQGVTLAATAFPVDAVDTTGCGDAFAAGFLHAHLRAAPPAACAALGNALGALAAIRPGAADALPTRDELRAFLEAHAPELLALAV
jgi:sugar/nucleoside kinase (ribokinase family)